MPYEKDHRCANKNTQLFLLEVPGTDSEDTVEEEEGILWPGEELTVEDMTPRNSVSAVNGEKGFQTIRFTGFYGKKPLHILIYSGSTHNFLDVNVARRLGCKLDAIRSQAVTVANGNQLQCQFRCRKLEWRLQRVTFSSDMLLIPLGSCDMVLGVQWLSTLGTVKWNFKELKMEFVCKGRTHVLRGIRKGISLVDGGNLPKVMHNSVQLCLLQLQLQQTEADMHVSDILQC